MQPRLPWRPLAALFLLTLFLAPLPGIAGPFWRVLEDTAHVLLFAALTPVLALWLSGAGLLAGRSLLTVNACAWGLARSRWASQYSKANFGLATVGFCHAITI